MYLSLVTHKTLSNSESTKLGQTERTIYLEEDMCLSTQIYILWSFPTLNAKNFLFYFYTTVYTADDGNGYIIFALMLFK